MVEGSGADDLVDGTGDGDGEGGLDLAAGKQDALIGKELAGVCDIGRGAGVKEDVVS